MKIPNLKAIRDWCLSNFQQKGDYALSSDIPEKTSDLTNDSGFVTDDDLTTTLSDYLKKADVETSNIDFSTYFTS